MKKIALVTGVTSGIGLATARILAKNGYNLIITGRRKELLEKVKTEITANTDAQVLDLNFDLRKRKDVVDAIASLPEKWKAIDVLVNNAGLASGLDPIQSGDIEDWEKMIDTNVKGLLYITREVAPLMVARNNGHIINISSIAGHEVYPNGNVYCATKHAVEALNKAMRMDMVKHNIKVTSIAPGMVETEFSIVRFHGDTNRAKKFYDGLTPLNADDIADAILYVVTRPAHVCINEMLIMPTAQASATVVNRS
ncbi:MAG TPA: SDR family oxidoreductase [Bacteroidales bacterium]|nr:SDR family oxidoreductase [Bacteroidales bacterium]